MSTVVGEVSKLEGIVRAINPVTGEVRILEEGSQVMAGEIIQTSGKGGVVVDMNNGTLLTLGRDTQMRMDDDVSGQATMVDAGTEGAVDIEALQQAVLEGNFDELEATAAGEALLIGSASDGGITVERIALQGEVTAGFDTSADEQTFDAVERDAEGVDAPEIIPVVSISGAANVWEGNQATYTVTTDTVSTSPIIVSVVTGHITTQNGDYVPVTQDVTIPAGQTSADFTVQTTDDALADSGEQYEVSITGATGAEFNQITVDPTAESVTTTIIDASDPQPPVTPPGNPDDPDVGATVSITGQAAVWEGNTATYTVTTDTVSSQDITVNVETKDAVTNPATGGVDYVTVTKTVTIPAGQSSAIFTVQTTDDALADSGEQYTANITGAAGAEFEKVAVDPTADSVTTTIVDASDPQPPVTPPGNPDDPDTGATVSIKGDATVWEGNQATYTVETDTISTKDITVNVETKDAVTNPATGGVDYVTVTKTVTIPAGQASATFTVQTTDDALADSGEQYTANITGAAGAEFEKVAVDSAKDSVTTTIVDASDPQPPVTPPGNPDDPDTGATVSIAGDATVWEGNSATYTVTTDTISTKDIIVNVETKDALTNPATGGVDYVTVIKQVTIPAGQASATFTVQTTDDALADSGEKYTANITGASGAEFEKVAVDPAADSVTTTIVDASDPQPPVTPPGNPDDPDVGATVSITGDKQVNEGQVASYTVTTDTVSSSPIIVSVTTGHITTENGDYIPVTQDVTIPAGASSANFTVTTNQDNIDELTETYNVSITSAKGAEFEKVAVDATKSNVDTDIIDDDTASLSINDVSVHEDDGSMTFTVTLSTPSDRPVTVDYHSENGTATAGLDYTAVTGGLTFAPGEVTKTITVPVSDDFIYEGSETLDMVLTNPVNATISDGVGLGIISDEPVPGKEDTIDVKLSGDTSVVEGGTASYTVTISEKAITNMDVDVVIGHITTENGDLMPKSITVTIPAGSDSVDFTVDNNDDVYAEGKETYKVELSGITTGGGFEKVNVDKTPVNTDINDDTIPQTEPDAEIVNVKLSGDKTVAEGGTASYKVTVDEAPISDMVVEIQTGHITTENGDLIPTTQLVTIPAGVKSATFTVDNNQDNIAEGNEDYSVVLTGNTTGGGFETVNVDKTPVATTIIDDEGTPSLRIDDVTVNEDAGTMVFTVTLSTPTTDAVTFDYASADQSAKAGADYTAVTGSGSIAAGSTTTTITVPIIDDYIAENPETFAINLSNPSANAVIGDGQGIGTILDEGNPGQEDTVTVTLSGDTRVEESATASYKVSIDKVAPQDIVVSVVTGHVTTENGDYVPVNTTVTIPAGQLSAGFTVATIDDAYAEGDEDYTVTMTGATGGGVEKLELGNDKVTTTIYDESTPTAEDTATVSIAGDAVVLEGNSASYTVSVDKVPTVDMTVDVTYSYKSAESGDIVTNTTQVTIPANSTSVPFNVATVDDVYAEGDEVYTVNISNPSMGGFEKVAVDANADHVDTTIKDDTTPNTEPDAEVINVKLSGQTTVAEGGTATYTVTVDEPTASDMVVEVKTGHITTENGDLIPTTTTVTIPAGQKSVNFTVDNNDDNISEGNEDYNVVLTGNTTGGGFETVNVDKTPVVTTIMDDEGKPSLIIDDVTVNEDAGTMTFTVTLSNPTTDAVTFDYASADQSAKAGADYTAVTGSGSIAAGSTTTTITVPVIDDYIEENPETFAINLSNPSANAVIADGQGIGTILDEGNPGQEDTVTVTLAGDARVEESATASYTVSIDKVAPQDIVVSVVTGHVTTENGDYVPVNTTVTIPAGQMSAGFTVDTIDDAYAEGDEDYTVTMTGATGGGVEKLELGNSQVTTTIYDESSPTSEDTATVSIRGDISVVEGTEATYIVSVDRVPSKDLVVSVVTGHVTTENGDYVPVNTTVTIPAGQTQTSFKVKTLDDALAEVTEDYTVTLTGTTGGGFEKTILGTTQVTTAITDETDPNDPENPRDVGTTLSISGDTATEEGNAVTYTVSVTNAPVKPMDVEITISEVTTNGDITPKVITVTIPAGQTSTTFTVDNVDDAIKENPEDYKVAITGNTNGGYEEVAYGNKEVTTTITDEGTPPEDPTNPRDIGATVSLSTSDVDEDNGVVTFTATLTAPALDAVTVTTDKGTILIAQGQTTGTLTVDMTDPDVYIDATTVSATITDVTDGGYEKIAIDSTPATAKVADTIDDTTVTITTSNINEDQDSATFDVKLSNAPQGSATVEVTVNGQKHNVSVDANGEGSLTINGLQDSDVYKDASSITATVTGVIGGNYENVVTGQTATAQIADTIDTTTVTLNDVTVDEGTGTATIGATITAAPTDAPLVLTLSNGATVTFAVGATTATSTAFAIQGDDVYVDADSSTVSVTNVAGGAEFEKLDTTDTAKVTVNDTIDDTTVTITTSNINEDQDSATFDVKLSNAPQGSATVEVTVNGQKHNVSVDANGEGSLTINGLQDSDVYKDASSITATVTGVTGGNYENVVTGQTATAQIADTIDTTTVTLNDVTVDEGTGTATIGATITAAPTDAPLVLTLSNGATVTFAVGATTATSTAFAIQGDDVYVDADSSTVSVTNVAGGAEFEKLDTTDTAKVTVDDTIDTTTVSLDATASVSEDGGVITYTATIDNKANNDVTVNLANGETITIKAGDTTGEATVTINRDDLLKETDSTSTAISSVSEANAGTAGSLEKLAFDSTPVTTQIVDDNDSVYAVIEGPAATNEGDLTGNFTVKLLDKDGNAVTVAKDTTVEVVFANGTAENGDYDATTQNVVISAGSSSNTFTVQTNVDVDLDDETFTATINSVDDQNQFENVDINGFTDTNGTAHVTTVTAEIIDGDTAPEAANGNVITCEDTTYTFSVTDFKYSDVDGDAMQAVRIDSLPADGKILLDGVEVTAPAEISVADINADKLTFVPDLHESGRDELPTSGTGDQKQDYAEFNFSVSDGTNWSAASAAMTIDVTPVADTPDLAISGTVENPVTIDSTNVTTSNAGFTVTAYNFDGSQGEISTITGTNHDGFGVKGDDGAGDAAPAELAHDGSTSQKLVVDFDADASSVDVAFAWQHSGEEAQYEFYLDGVKVGEGSHFGISDQVDPAMTLKPDNGSMFDQIVFSAPNENDDWLIHEIEFTKTETSTTNVTTLEGGEVELAISSALVDTDGSETLGLMVNDIPEGMTLTDGTNSFTATANADSADVTSWNVSALKLTIPDDYIGNAAEADYTINVVATATESIKQYITAQQSGQSCPLEATATVPFEIKVVDKNVPVLSMTASDSLVDEDPLATAASTSTSGSISTTNVDSISFADYNNTASGFEHNGVAITLTTSADGQTVTGSAGNVEVFTAAVNDTATGYDFVLKESVDHADANGENNIALTLGIVGTAGAQTVNADVTVTINDDVPEASDITINESNDGSISISGADLGAYVPEDDTTLTWDLNSSTIPSPLYVDGKEVSFSVDGDKVVGTVDNGATTVFTLDPTLANGTGSTYSLDMTGQTALGQVSQATGFDVVKGGNTDTAEFNFTDASGTVFATATVTAKDSDTTDGDTVNTRDKYIGVDNNWIEGGNGNELTFDYGSDQVKAADFSLNGLDSGETAKWTAEGVDSNGNPVTFTGTVAGTGGGASSSNDEYFTINAPADGYITKLTFEAEGSDEYRLGFEGLTVFDYNTDVDMSFNYTLTDADADTDSGSVAINLSGAGYDKAPIVNDEVQTLDFASLDSSQTTNVVITLDVSGSMDKDGNPNIGGKQQRLDLAKDAIENMVNSYDGMGDVNVRIVTFGTRGEVMTNSSGEEWLTATEALNIVNGLSHGGWTNYEDAVYDTYNNYSEPTADKTVAYFISDGEPTSENKGDTFDTYSTKPSNDSGQVGYNSDEAGWLDSSYVNGWNNFVDSYVDDLYVVGISNDIQDTSYLDTLAAAGDTSLMMVRDVSQLEAAIDPKTISVSGTVTDNYTGGDGVTSIDSISVDGTTYTSATFPAAGVAIGGEGKLLFDFSTGGYTYSANDQEFNADELKTFSVTVSDADGDAATFEVDLSINTTGDNFLTGSDGAEDFIIPADVDTHIENFNASEDTLDLSEVITDTDSDVAANTLAEYLDFALVDSDNDGQVDDTAITIDSNGESDAGGDVRTVFIEDQDLTNTSLDDLKIDYQND